MNSKQKILLYKALGRVFTAGNGSLTINDITEIIDNIRETILLEIGVDTVIKWASEGLLTLYKEISDSELQVEFEKPLGKGGEAYVYKYVKSY